MTRDAAKPDPKNPAAAVREGGCLCGKVRFRAHGEPVRTLACHCRFCQRATGSSFYAEAIFAIDKVEFTGSPMASYAHRSVTSSQNVHVHFCPQCGSTLSLTFERWPDHRALSVGAFDGAAGLRVDAHIWLESAQAGVALPAHTACFRQARATLQGVAEPSTSFGSPVTVDAFLERERGGD